MPKTLKSVLALGLVALVAACGGQGNEPEELVIIEPAPIVAEPVTNKW